jgi:NhaA family Na+:H+ antiporter
MLRRLAEPVLRFLHVEAASGVVLLLCTVAALVLANSPAAEAFLGFWKVPVGLRLGGLEFVHPLKHWINDGLMAIFFFVVGLEIKREVVAGELRDPRRAALPVAAALGGMIAPALIYLALQAGSPAARGWGIPMATDIAFVVGCMAILGPRIPHALRILVLSLAIVDDIGAILVIAVGYTEDLRLAWLAAGFLGLAAFFGLTRNGVRSLAIFTAIGAGVWLAFHESGVHATVAGVLLGFLVPAGSDARPGVLQEAVARAASLLTGDGPQAPGAHRADTVRDLGRVARGTIPPLEFLESSLHPWVAFGIMPLFALANAGVAFRLESVADPVALAVAAGLVLGKPLGIFAATALAAKLLLGRMPSEYGPGALVGAGCLAGIGFTMALFIAGLALDEPLLTPAKVGVLGGSLVAALLGMAILTASGRGARPPRSPRDAR